MSKCRYDLTEDCHSKDCLNCVLDKIRAEIEHMACKQYEHKLTLDREEVLQIIDKYRGEVE